MELSEQQKDLVWSRWFEAERDASPADAQWFVEQCARRGFSPLDGVLIPVFYKGKMSIITTIEALRLIANRTKEWAGVTDIEFTADGREWVKCWLFEDPPAAARVGVMRTTFEQPLFRVVRYQDFSTGSPIWRSMAPTMLGKCAEAAALRAAFPEADGLYVGEEMQQAGDTPSVAPPGDPEKPQSKGVLERAKANMDAVVDAAKATQPEPAPSDPLGEDGATKLMDLLMSEDSLSGSADPLQDLCDYIDSNTQDEDIIRALPKDVSEWPDSTELRRLVRAFIRACRAQ